MPPTAKSAMSRIFFVEDGDWSIHYLLVDTKNWWPGKKVLISPVSAQTIDWKDRLVNLNVDRRKVKDSPPFPQLLWRRPAEPSDLGGLLRNSSAAS
jgi:hypothetical protein